MGNTSTGLRIRRALAVFATATMFVVGAAAVNTATHTTAVHAADSADGLSVTTAPASIVQGSGQRFTLDVTDAQTSGPSFTTYLLSGLPSADWVVRSGQTVLAPSSTAPLIYSLPRDAALADTITIAPPSSYSGSLGGLALTRNAAGRNLVTDFDNGTFDFIGTDKPSLPANLSSYAFHDASTLNGGSAADCTNAQYGPCPGRYAIWPTAALHGPDRHFNNRWADLRSVKTPLSGMSTASTCQDVSRAGVHMFNGANFGGPQYTNTTAPTAAQRRAAGKFLIVNGTTLSAPNNVARTTITGLKPDTYYSFSGSLANLSIESNAAPVSVQFFLQPAGSPSETLVGTSAPLPFQPGCDNPSTRWTQATSLFYSGTATSVTIGVRNNNSGSYGNDLAVDELALREMATVPLTLSVTPRRAQLETVKSAAPPSAATVTPASEVAYTVTTRNTGNVALSDVVISDDLSGVLSRGALVAGSPAASVSPSATTRPPVLSGTTLTWTGSLAAGASVTLTYRVRVADTPGLTGELVNGVRATARDGSVSVPSNCTTGREAGCTTKHVIRDDRPARLTLLKSVVNDDGGTARATDFILSATASDGKVHSGAMGAPAVTDAVVPAGAYRLSENDAAGYTLTRLECSSRADFSQPLPVNGASVTLPPAQRAFCRFTNDDRPASLTLIKEVVNDDGGSLVAADFTLFARGPRTLSAPAGDPSLAAARIPAGTYELSESAAPGYRRTALSCFADPGRTQPLALDDDRLTLSPGATAHCVFTNDDIPPLLLPFTGATATTWPPIAGAALLVGSAAALAAWALRRTRRISAPSLTRKDPS